jgi:hypothetical protein
LIDITLSFVLCDESNGEAVSVAPILFKIRCEGIRPALFSFILLRAQPYL